MRHLGSPSSEVAEAGSEAMNPKGAGPQHPWDKDSPRCLETGFCNLPSQTGRSAQLPLFPNTSAHSGSDLSLGEVERGHGIPQIPRGVGRRHWGWGKKTLAPSLTENRALHPQTLPGSSQALHRELVCFSTAPRQLLVNVSCVGDGSQGLETGWG